MQINVVGRPDAQVRKTNRHAFTHGRRDRGQRREKRTIPSRQEAARTDMLWITIGVLVIFVVSMMS